MDKGVYCLIFQNRARTIRIGQLGTREFAAGWHLYVGSARGSGGLARAERHIRLFFKRDRPPRWHVDYLLLDPGFSLRAIAASPTTRDLECDLARALGGASVPGFGCSDCSCPSHLFFRPEEPAAAVMAGFLAVGLHARITTIKNEHDNVRI
ncbi:MAG: GIY-YIG nuclease family protein [Methanomicrobiaceae archaeon]|uniref:Endonuclease iii n=1 Tax=hydrocarbon metagenome TaxID=938273 RepID=A0A0W8FGI1_9ZZZZ|nr:GIY-YIG nuclease family protein [Methanomicrobiaceae archaeon]MDD5419278.1 GIY-YIG nuclease family protein [Methanomicrobiaceae archaeon]